MTTGDRYPRPPSDPEPRAPGVGAAIILGTFAGVVAVAALVVALS